MRSRTSYPVCNDWLTNVSGTANEITQNFYTRKHREWTARFPKDVLHNELRASEDVIQAAICVLDSGSVFELFVTERDAHPYCTADGVCANHLMATNKNRPNAFETLREPAPHHSAGKLRRVLEVVLELVDSAALRRLQQLASKWGCDAAKGLPREIHRDLVDNVVESLERESCELSGAAFSLDS